MTAAGFAADDKISTSGGTMSGTLGLQGTPAYTVMRGVHAGTVTLNGTTAVTVSTAAVSANTVPMLTVQPGAVPVGMPIVASVSAGSGFTVKSTSNSDTSVVVGWSLVEAV